MPTRKTLTRPIDRLFNEDKPPLRKETAWRDLVAGDFFEEDLTFGPKLGAALGISLERESLSWAIARGPLSEQCISGQVPLMISPVEREDETRPPMTLMDFAGHLRETLSGARDQLTSGALAGIGVAWPASVDSAGTPSFDHHPTFADGLVEVIREAAAEAGFNAADGESLAITFINDAEADLLHEARWGRVKGRRDVLSVKICGRIGGAILKDGHLARGVDGRAGEIGHLPINTDELKSLRDYADLPLEEMAARARQCECGRTSCVAQYGSGRAIIDTLESVGPGDDYNAAGARIQDDAAKRAARFDKHRDVFERSGGAIGQALLGPALALDPECILITAFPSHERLVVGAAQGLHSEAFDAKRFVLAEPNPTRTAAGAARLVIEDRIIPTVDHEGGLAAPLWSYQLPWALRVLVGSKLADVHDYRPQYPPTRSD